MTIKTIDNTTEKNVLLQELAQLKQEHRELDITITNMAEHMQSYQFEIGLLKRKKLKFKDAIARLESKLIPDLHA